MKILKPRRKWGGADIECPSCEAQLHIDLEDLFVQSHETSDQRGDSYTEKIVVVKCAECGSPIHPDIENQLSPAERRDLPEA
jgi:uncharacterized Zn finger protein